MLKILIKKLLPRRLHQPFRKVRWWVGYLSAVIAWRVESYGRGLWFQLVDLWHRFSPPALNAVRFETPRRPQISIVIPVHNQYRFTARCLISVAEADVESAFEVIVIDDRSTDQTNARLARVDGLRVVPSDGVGGFVHASNRGIEQARGDFVVLLNNDTTVEDGWLDRMVQTFDTFPHAGAVGARLIFADGRLQEAGGIVWRDGSAWNYGRYLRPEAPRFAYAREVDYCSAACLMVRRSLLNELGGFDSEFAPGYYEDTDLAFRIRQKNRAVIYQPLARVHHYEGATSGRRLSAGMKRYQAEHKKLFYERWRGVLSDHRPNGEKPELEKERHVERRVLIIEPRMIRPDRDSGSLRMFNWIEVLQGLDYKVTLAPHNLLRAEPYVSRLQARGVEVQYAPFVASLSKYLRDAGELYDLVIVSRLEAAERHLEMARRSCPAALLVFDTVDLHFVREMREARLVGSEAMTRAAMETRRKEMDAARLADVTVVVSEEERRRLRLELPEVNVQVVSTIHRQHFLTGRLVDRRDLLFVGSFEHPPNIDAVVWMVTEVMPLIRAALADVRLHVVGANPPPEVEQLESASVRIEGFVADLDPYLESCRLSVAPLRYGAGVKGKINQSMSYGLPVVATSMASEGMMLEDGHDVLVADSAEEFARAVCRLCEDDELWTRLADGGRDNIDRHYSFASAEVATRRLLEQPRRPRAPVVSD